LRLAYELFLFHFAYIFLYRFAFFIVICLGVL
jgi:hypothetical protein